MPENNSNRPQADMNRELADYAMALDLIGSMSGSNTESEVIEKIVELFSMLCSPAGIVYLPMLAGKPGKILPLSSSIEDTEYASKRMAYIQESYAWTESGNGFILKIGNAQEVFGIIEVDGFTFPEYKQHYLNLALHIVSVLAITILNARNYEDLIKTRDVLTKSESRYRSLIENSPLCIHEIDMEGRIASMNQAGLIMMSARDESDVRGLLYLDAVSYADRERIGGLLTRAYAGESSEFEFKSSCLQEHTFKSCFVPIRNSEGAVEKLMGITEDITERKRAEEELSKIEWLLNPRAFSNEAFTPLYGDITGYNEDRTILNALGPETIKNIVNDFMGMLETSSAVYEKNGDYAAGIFSSGWCQFLDKASFKLCNTDDIKQALNSGKWLCHESCWTEVSKEAVKNGVPTAIECAGGIHIYAVPIRSGKEIIGAINFGYGDPPRSPEKLNEIAVRFQVDIKELSTLANAYRTRPQFVIDLAKHQLADAANLIGIMVERSRVEHTLQESEKKYRDLIEGTSDWVWELDENGVFTYTSPQARQITGYGAEEFLEKTPFDYMRPEEARRVVEFFRATSADRKPFNAFENSTLHKNGHEVVVETSGVPYFDADGRFRGYRGINRDITARKLMENILKNKDAEWQNTFDSISDLVSIHSLDFKFIKINKALADFLGVTPEETIGRPCYELYHNLTEPLTECPVHAMLESRKPETREVYDPGRGLSLLVTTSPVFDSEGEMIASVHIAKDISERKRAENELRVSEQKFMLLFMQSPIPLGVVNNDGGIVYFNDRFTEVFGYTIDDIPTLKEWWQLIYPEESYRQRVKDTWGAALVKAAKDGTEIEPIEYKMTCKSGEERIVLIGGSILKDSVLATFLDITERKRAEEKLTSTSKELESIIEAQPNILYVINTNGDLVKWNAALEKLCGLSPEMMMKRPAAEFVCEEDRPTVYNGIREVFEKGSASIEVRFTRADGALVPHLCSGSVWKNPDGEVLGFIGIGMDMSERKKTEKELKRSNAELEQFSYAISHDMRQPLRMISSYMQLIETGLAAQLDSEKREWFNFAIDGAKRLDQMLLSLLEYSRIGRKGEPYSWIESRAVLDEALLFLKAALTEADADLRITGDWPRIFASHDEMVRLLQNLIGNAVKFRVAGRRPEINIYSETVEKEWHLSLSDNGVGIVPEQLGRLFQVFQRLQLRTAYEGTGVGLALCRKIVEHHGGRIWAESAGEGLGSRFYVTLPVPQEKP